MIVEELDYPLILASRSPRRRELLTQIGISFELMDIEIDETVKEKEAPISYVERMALEKAKAAIDSSAFKVFENYSKRMVLCADTSVVCDDEILGKPDNINQAITMLTKLAGRKHRVMTAIAIASQTKISSALSITEVTFAELSDSQVLAYCQQAENLDKAGGYAIQGKAAQFVTNINGSYSGVVGLPLYETCSLLAQHLDSVSHNKTQR